ncbi:MAG TPA: TIGR03560 family F420-dependent LLM class oxidoreductase [Dehalococcoidia bacterium]|nr:TIGR03560 family F420-dependent LLM class oxidoreductase [Dehalococcoidia bacterium]
MDSLFFGSQLSNNGTTWKRLVEVASVMDAGSWHSLWVYDHFMPPAPGADESGDCFESWSLLSGLATVTERVRIGNLVSGNTFRNPALLAKIAATIDQMSGGRLELGIGAAWHQREHAAYGWNYPSIKERSDRLEEACAIIRSLFRSDGPVSFQGEYYTLDEAPFAPKCAQTPHAPIMVGGGGEKRTLRTLSLYGDVLNVSGSPEQAADKIAIMEKHCADVGRDPSEITRTVMIPVVLQDDPERAARFRENLGAQMTPEEREQNLAVGTADQVRSVCTRYQQAGIDGIMMSNVPNSPKLYARLNDEVVEAFA